MTSNSISRSTDHHTDRFEILNFIPGRSVHEIGKRVCFADVIKI